MNATQPAAQRPALTPRLTLKMNVLVLMYFPVHVRVSVRVNVRVDFRVDFRGSTWSSVAEEELLLLGQVLLIVQGTHAVFFGAGRRGGACPVPLSVAVGALQRLCGRSAGRRAVFSVLAEPQQHGGEDEHDSSRDADDDGPWEGAGGCRVRGGDGRLCVCKRREGY